MRAPTTMVAIRTEDIWTEFRERLLAFVRRRVGSAHDAEDVLQEVFLRIHANLSRLRSSESVHGWVYRIARNAIADHYRAQARDTRAVAESAERVAPETEEADASSDLARCLRPLVERLPQPYEEALQLTELGNLTQRQAAEQLGLSVSGMKARVQRGRSQLKGLLLACCHVDLDRRKGVIEYETRDPGGPSDCDCDCRPEDCGDQE